MRTMNQGTLDEILKFVNKFYQVNRIAPTISEVAEGVGVARSTTHRYLQELSDRNLLDYGRGILSAPESAKMKTAYISAPLVGSIRCGTPEEEEEESVEEYVSLPVSLFGKGDFYILRAKGDSMVDAGIDEGDLLVIERNCTASEGDIVVALDQDQQNTLKRYVGFDDSEKCYILAYENRVLYPGEKIKLKSFEVHMEPDIIFAATANRSIFNMFSSNHLHLWAGNADFAHARKASRLFFLTVIMPFASPRIF